MVVVRGEEVEVEASGCYYPPLAGRGDIPPEEAYVEVHEVIYQDKTVIGQVDKPGMAHIEEKLLRAGGSDHG